MVQRGACKAIRFYARGTGRAAMAHMRELLATRIPAGYHAGEKIWVNPLTPWRGGRDNLAEYWVELR